MWLHSLLPKVHLFLPTVLRVPSKIVFPLLPKLLAHLIQIFVCFVKESNIRVFVVWGFYNLPSFFPRKVTHTRTRTQVCIHSHKQERVHTRVHIQLICNLCGLLTLSSMFITFIPMFPFNSCLTSSGTFLILVSPLYFYRRMVLGGPTLWCPSYSTTKYVMYPSLFQNKSNFSEWSPTTFRQTHTN